MKKQLLVFIAIVVISLILMIWFRDQNRSNVFSNYYYFDANGTTPIYPSALRAYTKNAYLGNASAKYGSKAKEIIKEASGRLLKWCGVDDTHTVIFNSGASEGNNHVLKAFAHLPGKPHFIVSSIEHKTSIDCCKWLEQHNMITVTWVKPNIYGVITAEKVAAAILSDTVLISVMAANNELGSKNPIYDIAKLARQHNIQFHSDAVQLIGKEPVLLTNGPTVITGSFHKFHGPQGLGFVIFKKCVGDVLKGCPGVFGSQFKGFRGGTENIPAIAAASEAMRITFYNRPAKNRSMVAKKNMIMSALTKEYPIMNIEQFANKPDDYELPLLSNIGTTISGIHQSERSAYGGLVIVPMSSNPTANTLTLAFVKRGPIDNKFCNIVLREDLFDENVIVSIGSACSAGKIGPSHVLQSLDIPHIVRAGVVRISLHDKTTKFETWMMSRKLLKCIKKQL